YVVVAVRVNITASLCIAVATTVTGCATAALSRGTRPTSNGSRRRGPPRGSSEIWLWYPVAAAVLTVRSTAVSVAPGPHVMSVSTRTTTSVGVAWHDGPRATNTHGATARNGARGPSWPCGFLARFTRARRIAVVCTRGELTPV